jgi:hypothetical protein
MIVLMAGLPGTGKKHACARTGGANIALKCWLEDTLEGD